MPHFCHAAECQNTSDRQQGLSFHGLPITIIIIDNKALLSQWITKLRKNADYFSVTIHTKIYSAHFQSEGLVYLAAEENWMKKGALPFIYG